MRASDDPHGVFSLKPEQQSVVVVGSFSQVNRALVINVTRLAGLFGNASVGYKIGGGAEEAMDIREMVGEHAEGRLFFSEGQASSAVTVLVSREVGPTTQPSLSLPKHLDVQLVPNVFPSRCFCQSTRLSQQS